MCKIYIHIYVRWGWWLLNFFLFPFLTIKIAVLRTFVYTVKVKQAKETNKQNLEYFKMINRRLFIHKFCNNSKMLLSSSWAIFIRALVFSSSPRANFSSFEYLCFLFLLIFRFILIYNTRVQTENNYIIIKTAVSIIPYDLFWCNKTQSRSFFIQLVN